MMQKHYEAMAKAEAEGASPESLSALSVRQYLARKPLEDALEIDSPVPPMPSEPIEPQREDYPNTRSGAKQYQDAKKAFDAEQASKEISELSDQDAKIEYLIFLIKILRLLLCMTHCLKMIQFIKNTWAYMMRWKKMQHKMVKNF